MCPNSTANIQHSDYKLNNQGVAVAQSKSRKTKVGILKQKQENKKTCVQNAMMNNKNIIK